MNLAACAKLARESEKRFWYRAIEAAHWLTPLQTAHSIHVISRYSEGSHATRPFQVLYLAEDHQVALYEVRALHGRPSSRPGSLVVPNPNQAWTILNVRVALSQVVDLTQVAAQHLLGTTAQELTGDWESYHERQPTDSVHQPVGTAPTQALGQALFDLPELEGFVTVSAQLPWRKTLVIFPEKLQPDSRIIFDDTRGNVHFIEPRRRKRRRSR